MEKAKGSRASWTFGSFFRFLRKFMYSVISVGPMPNHIAFILDGNRRYEKKWQLSKGTGHRFGFMSLFSILKYCFELKIRYVTIYAFSIDNFRRKPEEIDALMDLFLEKVEVLLKNESILNRYGVKICFLGNLKLLSEPVGLAAEKLMLITSKNSQCVLLICIAYTSTDEIVHSVQESCGEKWGEITAMSASDPSYSSGKVENKHFVKLTDIEKHMYMAVAPDLDILIRTSDEKQLSNFLLWQSSYCYLYSTSALWPEIGLRHLLWAILNFQRIKPYLDKRRKQL